MGSEISAIVLAGGASSRMGFNKAFAKLAAQSGEGPTLIAQTVSKAKMLSADVVIVANDDRAYRTLGVRVVPDAIPGFGSLGGIYSGLLAARNHHSMVVGCDMPFLSLPLWRHMLALPRSFDVLMPRLSGHLEPLHAMYSKRCLGPVKELLERGERQIIAFLPQVVVAYVEEEEIDRLDPQRLSFYNVNTPQDLDRANELWGARGEEG